MIDIIVQWTFTKDAMAIANATWGASLERNRFIGGANVPVKGPVGGHYGCWPPNEGKKLVYKFKKKVKKGAQ